MPPCHITYNLDLFYLIKFIFLIFLWVPYLLSDITCIKVRFVNFKSNHSILPKRYRNNILASETMQVWVYLYTFFILFEYFIILLLFDRTFTSCLPSKISLLTFNKRMHSVIHMICFLTFKSLIRVIFVYVYLFLYIPLPTLWYLQLVLSLSNDISENPGPQHINHIDGVSPYFSFCNWNLNTLSKYDFSGVSLLNAHNSIHKYDIISLCETSLSENEIVPENILQG